MRTFLQSHEKLKRHLFTRRGKSIRRWSIKNPNYPTFSSLKCSTLSTAYLIFVCIFGVPSPLSSKNIKKFRSRTHKILWPRQWASHYPPWLFLILKYLLWVRVLLSHDFWGVPLDLHSFISLTRRKGGGDERREVLHVEKGGKNREIGIGAFFTSAPIFHFHCENETDVRGCHPKLHNLRFKNESSVKRAREIGWVVVTQGILKRRENSKILDFAERE